MPFNIISNTDNLTTVEVVIPAETVTQVYDKTLNDFAKTVRMPGFRKGHLPRDIILKNYGSQIEEQARQEVMNDSIKEACQSGKFKSLFSEYVRITDTSLALVPGNEFRFSFEVDTITPLDGSNLGDLEVELLSFEPDDAFIEASLKRDQVRLASPVDADADDVVVDDSLVVIDFKGTRRSDGVAFDGGTATDFTLDIKNTPMIPGFSESIKGHKVGDTFVAPCTFPEDYAAKDLAGVEVDFEITVKGLKKKVIPEINLDFFKKLGITAETIEDAREQYNKILIPSMKQNVDNANYTLIQQALRKGFSDKVVIRNSVFHQYVDLSIRELLNKPTGKIDEIEYNSASLRVVWSCYPQLEIILIIDGLAQGGAISESPTKEDLETAFNNFCSTQASGAQLGELVRKTDPELTLFKANALQITHERELAAKLKSSTRTCSYDELLQAFEDTKQAENEYIHLCVNKVQDILLSASNKSAAAE